MKVETKKVANYRCEYTVTRSDKCVELIIKLLRMFRRASGIRDKTPSLKGSKGDKAAIDVMQQTSEGTPWHNQVISCARCLIKVLM